VNKCGPTPPLLNLITHRKTKTEQNTRQLCIYHHKKVDGLTGIEKKSKFIVGLFT
jgi:hypothetical protein